MTTRQRFELNRKTRIFTAGRGQAYLNNKEYDKAIDDLTIAILLDPKMPGPLAIGGLFLVGKKEFDKAIEDYNEAIRPIRIWPLGSPTGELPMATRSNTTRPSTTSPRPFDSTQRMPELSNASAGPTLTSKGTNTTRRSTITQR